MTVRLCFIHYGLLNLIMIGLQTKMLRNGPLLVGASNALNGAGFSNLIL